MVNFFDKLYTSINYKYSFLRRIKYYALLRRILLNIFNVIFPIYFKLTSSNPAYSLFNESENNRITNQFSC